MIVKIIIIIFNNNNNKIVADVRLKSVLIADVMHFDM